MHAPSRGRVVVHVFPARRDAWIRASSQLQHVLKAQGTIRARSALELSFGSDNSNIGMRVTPLLLTAATSAAGFTRCLHLRQVLRHVHVYRVS